MEHIPLALTNRDQKPKCDDIKVHDVVVSGISWFVVVVDGCTIANINSYVDFLLPKNSHKPTFLASMMINNRVK